ncbi:MAG TPA: preprotein translocase subunit SecE [Acidimicrobiales bacterium]|nr:preprotein translocase subunit SecE [Acidimicrobiales bacterium]
MNRQQRRLARRGGPDGSTDVTDGDDGDDGMLDVAAEAPGAEAAPPAARVRPSSLAGDTTRRRASTRQFLHEVNVEMRKVAWPTRAETVNYASVVLVTLAVLMALIFGLDLGFSKVALYLFK